MKRFVIAAALGAAAIATPALAQDADNFQGGHVELLVGYDTTDFNLPGASKPDGLLYGIGAGYDFATSNVVLGIEGEASDSTAKIGPVGARISAGRDLYIGGRIGVPLGDNTLVYAKAGYTNARIKAAGVSDEGDGVRAGAGLEFKLPSNIFFKAEYRYSNYEAGVERHQLVGGLGIRF